MFSKLCLSYLRIKGVEKVMVINMELINKEKKRCGCGCILELVDKQKGCNDREGLYDWYKCNNERCYLKFENEEYMEA